MSHPVPDKPESTARFDEWFAQEQGKGLVDVKFCLGGTSEQSATVSSVLNEFITAVKLIEVGEYDDYSENLEDPA